MILEKGMTHMKKIFLLLVTALLLMTACNNDQTEEPENTDNEPVEDTDSDNTDTPEDTDENTNDDSSNTEEDSEEDSTDTDTETDPSENGSDTDGNDTNDTTNDSDNPETDAGGSYSSDDAVRLVEEYLQADGLSTEMNYRYDGDDDSGNYRIQVFEVVDNGDGANHTATYGWYLVNPETGEITDLFN